MRVGVTMTSTRWSQACTEIASSTSSSLSNTQTGALCEAWRRVGVPPAAASQTVAVQVGGHPGKMDRSASGNCSLGTTSPVVPRSSTPQCAASRDLRMAPRPACQAGHQLGGRAQEARPGPDSPPARRPAEGCQAGSRGKGRLSRVRDAVLQSRLDQRHPRPIVMIALLAVRNLGGTGWRSGASACPIDRGGIDAASPRGRRHDQAASARP